MKSGLISLNFKMVFPLQFEHNSRFAGGSAVAQKVRLPALSKGNVLEHNRNKSPSRSVLDPQSIQDHKLNSLDDEMLKTRQGPNVLVVDPITRFLCH